MANTMTLKRHTALVDRMAQTLGFDLEEQVMRGQLDMDELGDAVLRCTACSNPEGCEAWLSHQTDVVEETPSMCRNTALFKELQAYL